MDWAVALTTALILIFLATANFTPCRNSPTHSRFCEGSAMATGSKPVKVFRHRGISASVFKNPVQRNGQISQFYKVNLQRAFKKGDGFEHNSSFTRDEVPVAILMLNRAWQFILKAESPLGSMAIGPDDNTAIGPKERTQGVTPPEKLTQGITPPDFHGHSKRSRDYDGT
jgi:hypothetical protein